MTSIKGVNFTDGAGAASGVAYDVVRGWRVESFAPRKSLPIDPESFNLGQEFDQRFLVMRKTKIVATLGPATEFAIPYTDTRKPWTASPEAP